MSGELFKSTGYATTITGAAFRAEISFYRLRIWLADKRRVKVVKTSNLEAVSIEPSGCTKLVLRLQKDLVIPTSHGEAVQLAKALDSLIAEKQSVELRNKAAGEALRQRLMRRGALKVRR